MNVPLEDFATTDKRIPMRDLIAGLQETLHRNHQKILVAARLEWERSYGGCDPTNGCVSIRITPARNKRRARRVVSGLN